MNRCIRLALLVAAGSLCACVTRQSSQPPQALPPLPPPPVTLTGPGLGQGATRSGGPPEQYRQWLDITPLTALSTSFRGPADAAEEYSDAYTRLIITSQTPERTSVGGGADSPLASPPPTAQNTSQYAYQVRNPVARYFWGARHTVNLTVAVSAGSFTATVPLVTLDHVSDRANGEKFDRTVVHTAEQFPLLLVKGDGSNNIASAHFQVKTADSVTSNVAATALQLAQNAARAASPQSAVVTSLTEQRTRDVAASIDSAVNQLFTNSLSEAQWLDNDIRRWSNGVMVSFRMPADEGDWRHPDQIVGNWFVTFEKPRPSVFSDVLICSDQVRARPACAPDFAKAARQAEKDAAANAAAVLEFQLVAGTQSLGTVAADLQHQTWWTPALTGFAKGRGSVQAIEVAGFCQNIKMAVAALNLNKVDGGIVANAVRLGLPLPDGVAQAMLHSQACGYVYPL